MPSASAEPLTIDVGGKSRVSGLLQLPPNARALYVLAHGAGAGMNHSFMSAIANEFATHGIGTLRYQFPYMEQGSKRPDHRRCVTRLYARRWLKPRGDRAAA